MSRWQDAHIGRESTFVSMRATPDEKNRLEELRRELRLTSKGQVLRMTLDALEILAMPATWAMDGPEGIRENREKAEAIRRHLAERFSVGGPDAECGLPASAPAPDQDDQPETSS